MVGMKGARERMMKEEIRDFVRNYRECITQGLGDHLKYWAFLAWALVCSGMRWEPSLGLN